MGYESIEFFVVLGCVTGFLCDMARDALGFGVKRVER